MNDMSAVIVPKSDQINADDLIAGPRTIRISSVDIRPGTEQPVSIAFDGDSKVYRPCKSMCRVMVAAWTADAKTYVGRSMTLYRDASVKWGGLEVGGIRISHLSHIDAPLVMPLTATKGVRKAFQVRPLVVEDAAAVATEDLIAAVNAAPDEDVLKAITASKRAVAVRARLAETRPELAARVDDAVQAALAKFAEVAV
jgi:hypothetical protein